MNAEPLNAYQNLLPQLSGYLNRPLRIGSRTIQNRLVFAPMTKLGHVAFRELLARYGGYGLLFSEMCSAKRIPRENRHVSPYFKWRDEEISGLVWQIVGKDAAAMADAARRIEAEGFFGVDVNFGCSVAAICRHKGGAAMLREPDRAGEIVSTIRNAVSIPVTVKYRTGWRNDPGPAVEMAKRFEGAGADALTFHPRMAPDRRSRPPRWEYIGAVKEAVSIPVFGNGNVFSPEDCLKMLRMTGCDGIAVGRMAIARPWLFAEWSHGFSQVQDIHRDTVIRLAALLNKHYEPAAALSRFKKFAFYFSANFSFGHTFYSSIRNAPHMDAVEDAIRRFFDHPPKLASRPNMNFFT